MVSVIVMMAMVIVMVCLVFVCCVGFVGILPGTGCHFRKFNDECLCVMYVICVFCLYVE